jgi:hypothetical protein
VGDEPLDRSHAVITPVDEEVIEVRWPREHRFTREVYIVPNLPVEEVTHELRIRVEDEGVVKDVFVPKSVSPEPGRYRVPMFKVGLPHRMVKFTWGLAPEKTDDTMDLSGRDSETNAMLEAMGYVARDGDDAPAPPAPSPAAPAPVAPE